MAGTTISKEGDGTPTSPFGFGHVPLLWNHPLSVDSEYGVLPRLIIHIIEFIEYIGQKTKSCRKYLYFRLLLHCKPSSAMI